MYQISFPNPRTPGAYTATVTAWDADNDYPGDAQSVSQDFSFAVYDQDANVAPPVINNVQVTALDGVGTAYDNMDQLLVTVSASSVNRIDHVDVETQFQFNGVTTYHATLVGDLWQAVILSDRQVGGHTLRVTAWDQDNDYTGDVHATAQDFPFTIVDEYPYPPTIESVVFAGASAGNTFTDDTTWFTVNVAVSSPEGITSVFVMVGVYGDYATLTAGGTYQARVGSPRVPGTYLVSVTAIDADLDPVLYPWTDQMTATKELTLTIVDPDDVPPTISSVQVCDPIYGTPFGASVPDNIPSLLVKVNGTTRRGLRR